MEELHNKTLSLFQKSKEKRTKLVEWTKSIFVQREFVVFQCLN
jgi:hypothetical protein